MGSKLPISPSSDTVRAGAGGQRCVYRHTWQHEKRRDCVEHSLGCPNLTLAGISGDMRCGNRRAHKQSVSMRGSSSQSQAMSGPDLSLAGSWAIAVTASVSKISPRALFIIIGARRRRLMKASSTI